jgi:hypothetical protein
VSDQLSVRSKGILPAEIASDLHWIRVRANRSRHHSEKVTLAAEDAETAISRCLRAIQWFYCECDRGLELPTIYKVGISGPQGSQVHGSSARTDTDAAAKFAERRRRTYERLWHRLEAAHLKIRMEDVDRPAFSALLRDINAYIIKNSIYLANKDHELADSYLKMLMEFRNLIAEAGQEEVERDFVDTLWILPSALNQARQARTLLETLNTVRDELLGRVRQVLVGQERGAAE